MKRSIIETVLGATVLAVAGYFLFFSYTTANVGTPDGYHVYADFSGIGGLKAGDDVQISGVKVGKVTSVDVSPETFLARVNMDIDSKIKLPVDSAALISSSSLLGGKYLALQPGADEEIIKNDGRIQYTQAPQNLEELLGKFIFSMNDKKSENVSSTTSPAESAAAPEAMPEVPPAEETIAPADAPESE